MADIKIKNWNSHNIRFVWYNGEWWAIARDVAEALGYSHAPSEKGVHNLHTPGRNEY